MSSSPLKPKTEALIARLARLTGSVGGLEAIMMAGEYTSPIVISLLLALAKLRDAYPRLRAGAGGKALGVGAAGDSLRLLANGWGEVGASMGQWRTVSRLVGLVAMILPSLKLLYPDPLKALLFSPIATLQIIGLLGYYPLEHIVFFARKGVLRMDPKKATSASIWSTRFWGLYVVAEYFKLHSQYASLKYRSHQLKKAITAAQSSKPAVSTTEAEAYELGGEEKPAAPESGAPAAPKGLDPELLQRKEALTQEWAVWKDQALINTGYTPLMIHWAVGGIWTNPLITSVIGLVPVYAKLHRAWRNAA